MKRPVSLPSDMRSPIFVGGQRRSGTTLLRVLLNRHPHIACGPETNLAQHPSFVAWHDRLADQWRERVERYGFQWDVVDRSMAALVDSLFSRYQTVEGKVRWAESTPDNILRIDYLFRLFPHAQFIHVIRDPRDTYCSIRNRISRDQPNWQKFTPERAAQDWCECIAAGKRWRHREQHYTEVKYEDLVHEPEDRMRRLLGFLHEPWDSRVLDPCADSAEARSAKVYRGRTPTTSVGRWEKDLDDDERTTIEAVAGDLMANFGYLSVRTPGEA